MPLGDVSEQQNHVSSYYGADDSLVPASFDAALYTGNPYEGGVEFDYPGYARVAVTNNTTNFVPSVDDDGSATATVTFPDATDEATTDDAKVWVLFNGSAIDSWDFLSSPLSVEGAGDVEPIEITPYIPNASSVSE